MKIRWMAWVPAVLMAGLAALTWWLDQMVQPLAAARDPASRNDPDFVVDNFQTMRMNLDGTAPADNPLYNASNGITARSSTACSRGA